MSATSYLEIRGAPSQGSRRAVSSPVSGGGPRGILTIVKYERRIGLDDWQGAAQYEA